MEGHFAVRSWIPKQTEINILHDTLTIYDAGNIQGFLIRLATGKTTWIVFQVDYRVVQEDGSILEGCEVLSETLAPLHYLSIETYPLELQQLEQFQFLFSLPQTQILVSLSEQPLPFPRSLSEQPLPFPRTPAPSQPPLPSEKREQRPSPQLPQGGGEPEKRGPPRSNARKPTRERQSSQNKSTSLPKQMALSSSNPNGHEQHLSQAPKTQGVHQQQLTPTHHNGHESVESLPWISLAQQSLYSRPPPELGVRHVGQA